MKFIGMKGKKKKMLQKFDLRLTKYFRQFLKEIDSI